MTDRDPSEADHRHARGLRLVGRCGVDPDVPALIAEFLSVIGDFGFDAVAGGAWNGIGRTRQYRFYFNNWPASWLALYEQRQLFLKDPVVAEAQRRMAPFLWSELEEFRQVADSGHKVLAAAKEYGWVEGLVIPIHGPSGYQGTVSLATFRPLDLAAADRALLWVMALALHERCRLTADAGGVSVAPKITARELECMRWVSLGKTDWEVAQLLGISKSTVHFHVERVKRRFAINTRAEAVALLVLHGAL